MTLPIVGVGAAAVKVTSDFESAMSEVQAISGATGSDFDRLSDKAKEMGAKTKFSASESAEAMNYMAMAGWKTEEMLDGIEGIMNLAAASGESLATTSDIVTDALTAFGLKAKDSGRFADVLAAASANANTNVSMLGESFKYVAPVAGTLKFSAEDTSIALGLMANNSIKASQAGTALRTLLSNMANPGKSAAAAMQNLGISLTDDEGNMLSLMEIMQDLRESFSTLTEAEAAEQASLLAGKTGMSGLLAIVNSSDEDFQKLTEAIYNAGGSAEEMANVQLNNLQGRLTIFTSALSILAISFGELLIPALTKAVEWITSLVDWLNSLDEGTKETIVQIAAVLAVAGPVLLLIGKLIGVITSVHKAVTILKPAIAAVNAVLAANPIAIVILAIGALVAALVTLYKKNEDFRNFVNSAWAKITSTISSAVNKIVGVFKKIPQKIEEIKNLFAQLPQKALSIGSNIVKGLWNGISSAAGWLKEKISGFANGIIGGFKKAFGIASPAKKLMPVGKFINEGLAVGLERSRESVLDSVSGLSDDVISEYKKLPKSIDTKLSVNRDSFDRGDTSAAYLDNGFSSIQYESTLLNFLGELASTVRNINQSIQSVSIPLTIVLKLQDRTIGTAAISDINEVSRTSGKVVLTI